VRGGRRAEESGREVSQEKKEKKMFFWKIAPRRKETCGSNYERDPLTGNIINHYRHTRIPNIRWNQRSKSFLSMT